MSEFTMTTFADMSAHAVEAQRLEKEVAGLEYQLGTCKLRLAGAKAELDLLTARRTLQWQAEGRMDGKNAETRAAQLAVLLADDPDMARCRGTIHDLEGQLLQLEQRVAESRALARLSGRLFEAALASLGVPLARQRTAGDWWTGGVTVKPA